MKFHDGEVFDATAAKYSLDRHLNMKGSFRKPELAQVDTVEVVDPSTIKLNLKTPFSPLLAQLTDRAGMMVSPKAAEATGDKFGLKPVCAGPYKFVERVQQDRIVVEKFADYWNKDQVFVDKITYLPIVDATVRLANLRSGGLDMIERRARHRHQDGARQSQAQAQQARVELGYQGLTHQPRRTAPRPPRRSPRTRACDRPLELSIDREALNQVVFNGEFVPGNQWINPQQPLLSAVAAGAEARRRQGQGAAQGGRASRARSRSTSWCRNNPETRQVAEVLQSMAAEAGFDLKIRVTESPPR